jgi:hypothetical protein
VPEVLVTVPELTVTPTEYVNRSAAHAAGVVTVIVGIIFTVAVTGVREADTQPPFIASA